jgi:hypothetical protein
MKSWLQMTFMAAVLGLAGCGDDDDGGSPDGGGGGVAPVIDRVQWQRAGACTAGSSSSYTVTTTAADTDTNNAQLTFRGAVSSCTPNPFTQNPATITCPNAANYNGSMTVSDPQGNTDIITFTVMPCRDGMVP